MDILDLHRTKHEDVRRKVIRVIEDNWNTNKKIKIITGHSAKMKRIVKDVLDEYTLEYSEGDYLQLNKGFLIINIGE